MSGELPEPKNEEHPEPSAEGGDRAPDDGSTPQPAIEAPHTDGHGAVPSEQGSITEKDFVDRINRSDRWMIYLTASIAFSGLISAAIFGWQLHVMQGQLTEMKTARISGDQSAITQMAVMQSQANAMHEQADTMRQQLESLKSANAETERAIAATNRLAEETAKTAADSRRLADAAVVSNAISRQLSIAANNANKISSKSLTQVQRAFIVVNAPNFEPIDKSGNWPTWMVDVSLENMGNTPSADLQVRTRCETTQKTFDNPYNIPSPGGETLRFGWPIRTELAQRKRKVTLRCPAVTHMRVLISDKKTEMANSYTYVFGSAEYRDIFDPSVAHITEFCFLVFRIDFWIDAKASSYPDPPPDSWITPCMSHNCIDDECSAAARKRATDDLKADSQN
jgi:hypothetical protein